MITAASAHAGRAAGIEVYDLDPPVRTDASGELHADLAVRGIEHGDTSYEVRIFFNTPDADGDTPRTTDAGYAGRISVSGHGHHTGDDPNRPRLPIDVRVDVTDGFRRALETVGGVESITLVPTTHPVTGAGDPVVTDSLWRFADFELRIHAGPRPAPTHIVDEFGAVTDTD